MDLEAQIANYRLADASEKNPKKRKKLPWVPSLYEYYDRRARIVGCCILSEAEAGGGRGMNQGDPAWDRMMGSQHIHILARQEAERMDSASIRVVGVGSFSSIPDGGRR